MILQRLATAIRKQDWFTVVIETLIVVFGVYLGIQLGNWNAASNAAREETVILEQLHSQFEDFVAITEVRLEQQRDSLRATDQLLEVIATGKEPDDRNLMINILQRAGRLKDAPTAPTTLLELISSGRLSELSSATLRGQLTQFQQQLAEHRNIAAIALHRISDPTTGRHKAVISKPYTLAEVVDYNWELIPEMRAEQQVLQIGKYHLTEQMAGLIELAKAILSEIEAVQP
ncbi:DUF6090 family protein [Halioxenophilus aromaticivorans]|uniref:Uncharacterized protein n=1 Tax=Halioxenophilus aromaticivorans TaxID=1306992 RepID=A0AAV3U169_9ALTE